MYPKTQENGVDEQAQACATVISNPSCVRDERLHPLLARMNEDILKVIPDTSRLTPEFHCP